MTKDYTTIRVTKAAKADADASKRDDETWNDYLQRCTDTPPECIEVVPAADVSGGDAPDQAALAELHDALATIEERTGRIERAIEELGGGR